jgi:hypothetical protein
LYNPNKTPQDEEAERRYLLVYNGSSSSEKAEQRWFWGMIGNILKFPFHSIAHFVACAAIVLAVHNAGQHELRRPSETTPVPTQPAP